MNDHNTMQPSENGVLPVGSEPHRHLHKLPVITQFDNARVLSDGHNEGFDHSAEKISDILLPCAISSVSRAGKYDGRNADSVIGPSVREAELSNVGEKE